MTDIRDTTAQHQAELTEAVATWAQHKHTRSCAEPSPVLTVGELIDHLAAAERHRPVRLSGDRVACEIVVTDDGDPVLGVRAAELDDDDPAAAAVDEGQIRELLRRWITGWCGPGHTAAAAATPALAATLAASGITRGRLHEITHTVLRRLTGHARLTAHAVRTALTPTAPVES